jgi:hypothetical protein
MQNVCTVARTLVRGKIPKQLNMRSISCNSKFANIEGFDEIIEINVFVSCKKRKHPRRNIYNLEPTHQKKNSWLDKLLYWICGVSSIVEQPQNTKIDIFNMHNAINYVDVKSNLETIFEEE